MKKFIKSIISKLLFLELKNFKILINTKRGYYKYSKKGKLKIFRNIKKKLIEENLRIKFKCNYFNLYGLDKTFNRYLQDNIIHSNSEFFHRLFYYEATKKPIIYPLPKKWIDKLNNNNFKSFYLPSFLFWIIKSLFHFILGNLYFFYILYRIMFNKLKKLFNYKQKIIKSGEYVFFIDIENSKVGLDKKIVDNYNLLNWYQTNFNKSSYIILVSTNHKVDNFYEEYASINSQFNFLLEDINLIKFLINYFVLQIYTIINFFFADYSHLILFKEMINSLICRNTNKKLPKEINFLFTANSYYPLWCQELERKGVKINLFFDNGFNSLSEKPNSLNLTDLYDQNFDHWSNIYVWDEFQKKIIQELVNNKEKVQTVDILTFSEKHELKNTPYRAICIFPYDDHRFNMGISTNSDYIYYNKILYEKFLKDIVEISKKYNFHCLIKNKRTLVANFQNKKNLKIINQLSKENNIIIINPDVSAKRLIENCLATISMPFTSTGLIANNLNKPSIFYDPVNYVQENDKFGSGVKIIKDKNILENYIKNLDHKFKKDL